MRLFACLAWFLALIAQPALAQPAFPQTSPQLLSLERRLAALATENPGEYGFAALDLSTGASVSFNGHRPFPMASTMKIAVAAAYLSRVDAGQRRLDDWIGNATAADLMDRMIVHSNNRATDQLMNALGGPTVIDRWLRSHQLGGMRVDRTIASLLADRRDLHDIRDSSTPAAMINLLRLIDSGNALSPTSRALLLDMMRRCATGSNRIRGLMPPGVRVEHKTGTLNGYTSDVGYLTTPDGRRIAVVFFARGGDNRPAVISTAARAVYDTFGTPSAVGSPLIQARATSPYLQPRPQGQVGSLVVQARAQAPAATPAYQPRSPGLATSTAVRARSQAPVAAPIVQPRPQGQVGSPAVQASARAPVSSPVVQAHAQVPAARSPGLAGSTAIRARSQAPVGTPIVQPRPQGQVGSPAVQARAQAPVSSPVIQPHSPGLAGSPAIQARVRPPVATPVVQPRPQRRPGNPYDEARALGLIGAPALRARSQAAITGPVAQPRPAGLADNPAIQARSSDTVVPQGQGRSPLIQAGTLGELEALAARERSSQSGALAPQADGSPN